MTNEHIQNRLLEYLNDELLQKDGVIQLERTSKPRHVSDAIISRLLSERPEFGNSESGIATSGSYYSALHDFFESLPPRSSSDEFRPMMPPEDVHMMGRGKKVFLDLKNCDQFTDCLFASGIPFPKPGGDYLDFGCSSGRTVRTLSLYSKAASWHGCDPVHSSIQWASENIPDADFFVSSSMPWENTTFGLYDGVFAFSVWSHFSKERAIDWLNHFYHHVRDDGFLLLSVHSPYTLAKLAINERFRTAYLESILDSLISDGYFFDPAKVRQQEKRSDGEHWGRTFYTRKHFLSLCRKAKWHVVNHSIGAWGDKQDIYILSKAGLRARINRFTKSHINRFRQMD